METNRRPPEEWNLTSEERVVATPAHAVAGMDLGAPLADQDGAGRDGLSGEALHSESLGLGVAAVAG